MLVLLETRVPLVPLETTVKMEDLAQLDLLDPLVQLVRKDHPVRKAEPLLVRKATLAQLDPLGQLVLTVST